MHALESEFPFVEQPPPLLAVISGPSGAGKDTVIAELKKKNSDWHFSVSATTRSPRPGERDGVDYIFLDAPTFQEMRERGELLECAEYSGRWYGVPKGQVQKALGEGRDVFLKIEVQGAESIRKLAPEAVLIFLAPGSIEELEERLGQRRTENLEETEARLQIARQELAQVGRYDYRVVNRDGRLDRAVAEIEAIVIAEKCRVRPRKVRLD